MTKKRIGLFPTPPVMRVKQTHPEKFSQRVSTMLEWYQGILDYHRSKLELSDTERHQVAECLMGSVVDGIYIDCLDQELADAGHTELAAKIAQASYADRLVLIESLGRDLSVG